jgi:hypothetical protein
MLQDYRTAVCPFIDVVDYNNMEYRAQDEGARGAFDWQLYYKRQVPCGRQERLLCPSRTYVIELYIYRYTSIDIHSINESRFAG